MNAQLAFYAVIFIAVLTVGLVVTWLANPSATRERMRSITPRERRSEATGEWAARIVKLSGPLAKLSVPDEGWENAPLRVRFMNAGFRNPSAPVVFFAAKTVLALTLPALMFMFVTTSALRITGPQLMLLLIATAAIGFYLPNVVLSQFARLRKRDIFESLPDAIDLMTVCVEAGLGLDAALLRVAEEAELTSKPLAEELRLVSLELRAGSSKEKALRNFALRTGVEEVDAFVAMLVQSERFGTSIADSLRVHSDALRTKRRLRAEEAANKIAVKLVFPLIFGIFPAMLLVLAGPAVIRIYRVLLPAMKGTGGVP
jgi:tight adherence protein C